MKKQELVSELSASTGIPKSTVADLLEKLASISYREARNSFILPGICKLKVVRKKASKHRNPATGKRMLIGERDILKIVPLKRAKTAITPNLDVEVTILEDQLPSQETAAPSPDKSVSPPTAPQEQLDDAGQIVFECAECGGLIGAPLDIAGSECQCPLCQALNMVPVRAVETAPASADQHTRMLNDFVTFICQTCSQEIEAPVEMMGMSASCPTCSSQLDVPQELTPALEEAQQENGPATEISAETRNSMTLRIDLMDVE